MAPTYTNFLAHPTEEDAYWDNQVLATGTTVAKPIASACKGSVCQVTFGRDEVTGVREDVALIDMHLTVATGVNTAWDSLNPSDEASVEAAFDTAWGSLKLRRSAHWSLTGYVWRHFGADFPKGKTGLSKPGPIHRVTTRAVVGTSAANQYSIDQAAISTTFVTASRRHWGRVYVPPLNADLVTQQSRWKTASVDSDTAAWDTFFSTINALSRSTHLVVWNSKHPGFLSVSTLKVDDVPDVIRRRRPKVKTYEKKFGL